MPYPWNTGRRIKVKPFKTFYGNIDHYLAWNRKNKIKGIVWLKFYFGLQTLSRVLKRGFSPAWIKPRLGKQTIETLTDLKVFLNRPNSLIFYSLLFKNGKDSIKDDPQYKVAQLKGLLKHKNPGRFSSIFNEFESYTFLDWLKCTLEIRDSSYPINRPRPYLL
jgi:hypothetical protein